MNAGSNLEGGRESSVNPDLLKRDFGIALSPRLGGASLSEGRLTLFGTPSVTAPTATLGAKPLALLAYLALEPGRHARDELAALLWSDSPTDAARASLRQALRQIRNKLGDLVEIEAATVALGPDMRSDVREFLDASDRTPETAARYDVPRFLSGFAVRHASAFEEWAEATRQHLVRRYVRALEKATRDAMNRSRWRDAVELADRWLACEPLSETAAYLAIEALYMAGKRGEALARYQAHREHLKLEAGAEPGTGLRELAHRIAEERAPVTAQRTTPPGGAEGPPDAAFDPTLTGREEEWQRVRATWHEASRGSARALLIEGEAGVGKTRLAEELLQWAKAEGATVLRGQGYDPTYGLPNAPIIEALRATLDAPGLAGTPPAWLAEAARLLPDLSTRYPHLSAGAPQPEEQDARQRRFEAVAQVLLALAAERPTVLMIDDLQLCDAETCALAHFLTQRFGDAAILLLFTATLGEVERHTAAARLCRAIRAERRARVLTLGPLPEDAVWGMIRELGHVSTPEGARRFAHRVHTVTDGNPFHVLELLKALFRQGVLTQDPASDEWIPGVEIDPDSYEQIEMPRTVREAIGDRYALLPYEQRDILATIAVAGRGVEPAVLSRVYGISRLRTAALADALVELRLLAEEEGVYRCAHPVIREVVTATLTPARRRELHRALALALEALATPEELTRIGGEIAHHAERGGEPELASRLALVASEAAVGESAFEEALSWLDLAARVATTPEARQAVNARTAHVLSLAGWAEAPSEKRRKGTPSRGFALRDLDLQIPEGED